jgi:hypothetical protein
MKQEMYMFGTILMIMTLISALGGAIRYEENFYNEIFDLLDEDGPIEGSNQSDVADNSMYVPQNNDESLIREAPIVEEEMYSAGEALPPSSMESPSMGFPSSMETLEGYTGVEPYEEEKFAAI